VGYNLKKCKKVHASSMYMYNFKYILIFQFSMENGKLEKMATGRPDCVKDPCSSACPNYKLSVILLVGLTCFHGKSKSSKEPRHNFCPWCKTHVPYEEHICPVYIGWYV
jgi:hypothetical protein